MSRIITLHLMLEDDLVAATMPESGDDIAHWLSLSGWRSLRFLGGNISQWIPPKWVRITPKRYRGEDGYTVSASSGERMFTKTRASAERIRDRIKAGEDTRAEDWNL